MVVALSRRGFSLAEVLIATIIMSMIMTGVLGFVQYAGDIWRRGEEKMSTKAYSRMTFELLKDELLSASRVSIPARGASSDTLRYTRDGKVFEVTVATGSILVKREPLGGSKDPVSVKLASNVNCFIVNRISSWTFSISLQINEERDYDENGDLMVVLDEDGNVVEPDIISSETMILLAPGV